METSVTVKEGLTIPAYEFWFMVSRASGPGGQHVNKSSSRVTLCWSVDNSAALSSFQKGAVWRHLSGRINREGVFCLNVEDTRSQARNKGIAKERFAEILREALTFKRRRVATRPSRAVHRRRVDEKKKRGALKTLRRRPVES